MLKYPLDNTGLLVLVCFDYLFEFKRSEANTVSFKKFILEFNLSSSRLNRHGLREHRRTTYPVKAKCVKKALQKIHG